LGGGTWGHFVIFGCKHVLGFASNLSGHHPLSLVCALVVLFAAPAVCADGRQALETAAELVQQGKLEQADQQARLALSDPSTRAIACSVIGTILLQQNRVPEGVHYLREAIRLEPRLVGARLTLAQAYLIDGKPQAAMQVYREVLKLDAGNASARQALAQSEADRGNYQQSLALARPVSAVLEQTPDGLYLLATDYLKTGHADLAASLTNSWLQASGVPEEWSLKFALLLTTAGLNAQAIQILEHIKHDGPVSFQVAFNLAGVYLLSHHPVQALENYDAALKIEPTSIPALKQAAIVAEKQAELERSLSYWMRAKKLQPDDPDILLGFGRVCLEMDLLEDAEPALVKAAALKPDAAAYQYLLASVKVGKKQFDAAQSILEKLVIANPTDSQMQYALGSVFYLEGHLSDAAAHLQDSIRLQPQQVASQYYLALIARDEGRSTDAIERLEALLKAHPDHAPSCEMLGELLMAAHQYPEAEINLKKAVQLYPNSVKANYQLGLLLARMGKKDEANKQLELAKSIRVQDEKTSRLQLRLLDPDQ
jgi:tetratricopeptide (TPR) repeat protein